MPRSKHQQHLQPEVTVPLSPLSAHTRSKQQSSSYLFICSASFSSGRPAALVLAAAFLYEHFSSALALSCSPAAPPNDSPPQPGAPPTGTTPPHNDGHRRSSRHRPLPHLGFPQLAGHVRLPPATAPNQHKPQLRRPPIHRRQPPSVVCSDTM